MTSKLLSVLVFLFGFASSEQIYAEEQKLDFHGKVWGQFEYDATSGGIHKSGFDIYRAFLQTNYKFDDTWAATLLLDAQRGETITVTRGTGDTTSVSGKVSKANLWGYLRNAYVQGSNLWMDHSIFRFGLQPTPYISTLDSVLKARWLGKNLMDQGSVVPSQSAGVSYGFTSQNVNCAVLADNGTEGLTKTGASDNGLGGSLLCTLLPFSDRDSLKKLGLTLFNEVLTQGQSDANTTATRGSNVSAAALHFEHGLFDGAIEYLVQKYNEETISTATGYGATANFKFPDSAFTVYGRYFSGNDAFQTLNLSCKSLLTVGPSYTFVPGKVMTAVLYEKKATFLDNTSDTETYYWNWAVNF